MKPKRLTILAALTFASSAFATTQGGIGGAAPSLQLNGPTAIFEGQSAYYFPRLVGPVANSTKGRWSGLPDSSRITASYAVVTYPVGGKMPAGADIAYSLPELGMTSPVKAVQFIPYSTPDIHLQVQRKTGYAPFTTTVYALPAAQTPSTFMQIAKFKYEWNCPQWVTCKVAGDGRSVTVTAPQSSVSSVSVKATDLAGVTRQATIEGIEAWPDIPSAKLEIYWGDRYKHAPTSLTIRPRITHMPKGEKIVSSQLSIEQGPQSATGTPYGSGLIAEAKGEMGIKPVSVELPGTYRFLYTFATDKGTHGEAVGEFEVPANQSPVISGLTSAFSRDGKSISLQAQAKDPDGFVKKFTWYVNGKKLTTEGQYAAYAFAPGESTQYAIVSLLVTDNSGSTSEYKEQVTKQ